MLYHKTAEGAEGIANVTVCLETVCLELSLLLLIEDKNLGVKIMFP